VGDILNISLVDHLIVGEEKWFSMREEELMQ
jgi:DNA repair protein RadC